MENTDKTILINSEIQSQFESGLLTSEIQAVIEAIQNEENIGTSIKALRNKIDVNKISYSRSTPVSLGIIAFANFLNIGSYSLQRIEKGHSCSISTSFKIKRKLENFLNG